MKKTTYVTLVNKHYEPYLEQLIRSHQMFSRIHLIVYTINFEILDSPYKNIEFIRYDDNNILEFETTGENKYIKDDFEKHKYTTLLKPKILKNFLDSYDYYFFIDCDILLTKNSDALFTNVITEFGFSKFPISVKYFHQYSTSHNPTENIFNEYGEFNPKSLGYYPLIELYGTEFNIIDYLTTYCVYYSKECFDFLDEVDQICFDENVIKDYKKFLPLGDETVFNYLYSKYNVDSCISSYLCYDIGPFLGISNALNNIEKGINYISFIHTKRYITDNPYNKNFSNTNIDEYNQIFDCLLKTKNHNSTIQISSYDKHNNGDVLFFNVNGDYDNAFKVEIVSLFRPNKQPTFIMHLIKDVNYYISFSHDVWVKDQFLIIQNSNIIKDVIKIS
jgi:hypothetical protein